MDPTQLVPAVTGFLGPLLPYLMAKTGDVAASEAIKAVGKSTWQHARPLWAKLWPKVQANDAAREAAESLAADPHDEDARGQLRVQLKKLLAEDPELAGELARLIDHAREAGVVVTASGPRSVAIGGDAGGTIVTGDGNVVKGDG